MADSDSKFGEIGGRGGSSGVSWSTQIREVLCKIISEYLAIGGHYEHMAIL